MVIKTKQFGKIFREGANQVGGPSKKDFSVAQPKQAENRPKKLELVVRVASEEAVDVIDLGAPRRLRRAPPEPLPGARVPRPRRTYTPNPRLYPGPAAQPKRRPRRAEGRAGRAHRRVFRRPVPNARLYRPAPRRLPPPASPPRGPWPPPAPARPLETASRAALRLLSRRDAPHLAGAPPAPSPTPPAPRSRRLVVTLPAASAGMDAAARHSTSPDDCSDADALSAPSEFLAEFLSAIMRRQYAEALKYCRLILQYEPHNATARGFYPLLRHKVQALKRNEGAEGAEGAGAGSRRGSSSGSSAYSPAQQSPGGRSPAHSHSNSHSRSHSRSRQRVSSSSSGAGGGGAARAARSWGARSASEGSVASQSSLELDSTSASGSASAGSSSPAPADANGNPQPAHPSNAHSDDLKNDNDVSHIKSESTSSLRRLRAQFACSIK